MATENRGRGRGIGRGVFPPTTSSDGIIRPANIPPPPPRSSLKLTTSPISSDDSDKRLSTPGGLKPNALAVGLVPLPPPLFKPGDSSGSNELPIRTKPNINIPPPLYKSKSASSLAAQKIQPLAKKSVEMEPGEEKKEPLPLSVSPIIPKIIKYPPPPSSLSQNNSSSPLSQTPSHPPVSPVSPTPSPTTPQQQNPYVVPLPTIPVATPIVSPTQTTSHSTPSSSIPSLTPFPVPSTSPSISPISSFPSMSSAGQRNIPKFSDISVEEDDEPDPPPRSPVVSPRNLELPPLPNRNEITFLSTNITNENPVAPPPSVSGEPVKKKTREDLRNDCLKEIYQTEKDYIDDLENIISVFIIPLRAMQILPENFLYNIFSNVELLINCNKEMLKELEEKMSVAVGDEVLIGQVFTKLADYFKMYKIYCANQSTSLTTVEQQTKKNPAFKKYLDTCHTDPRCKGLFISSFLIKPVQRVCKYPLLLRELIRHTPEDHVDFVALQSAFSKINEILTIINDGQREAEGLHRIIELQKLIDGLEDTLVAPGRRLHKEGDLTFYKSSKSKHGEKRHVFFFSDLMLITNRKGDKKFEHKLSFNLTQSKLVVLADSDNIKNAFEFQLPNAKQKCILSTDTKDESNQWVKEIKILTKIQQKKEIELRKKGLQQF